MKPSHTILPASLRVGVMAGWLALMGVSPAAVAQGTQDCLDCHDDSELTSADGDMSCLTCHRMHKSKAELADFDPGCDACHKDVEARYELGAHRLGRQHGNDDAAMCADCHGSHHVLAAADTTSPVYRRNIAALCGKCHGQEDAITENFVRLPIRLPSDLESVHGEGWNAGGSNTATCTDCHGVHEIRHEHDEKSTIAPANLADTCGKCHGTYPMSTIWLNGRQPAAEWKETHRGEFEECGPTVIEYPESEKPEADRKSDPETA